MIRYLVGNKIVGNSGDTKPTNVENGTTFLELDTGDSYYYNNGWNVSSGTDTNYYLSNLTFNTNDGVLTATVTGASNQSIDLDGRYGILSAANTWTADNEFSANVNFGTTTRQMLNLYSTTYALGVQGSTLYQRTNGNFAWFQNGSHSDTTFDPGSGGSLVMSYDDSAKEFEANADIVGRKYIGKNTSDAKKFEMVYNEDTESVDFNFL